MFLSIYCLGRIQNGWKSGKGLKIDGVSASKHFPEIQIICFQQSGI